MQAYIRYILKLRKTLPEAHKYISFLESDDVRSCTLPSQVLDLHNYMEFMSPSDKEKQECTQHWLVIAMNEYKFDVIARSIDTANDKRLYKPVELTRHINRFRDSLDRIRLKHK
jgi:hypothetical protein